MPWASDFDGRSMQLDVICVQLEQINTRLWVNREQQLVSSRHQANRGEDSPTSQRFDRFANPVQMCDLYSLSMLAAVAEMERDLLIERTQAGLARAKAEGKTLGRPSKTTPEQRRQIRQSLAAGDSVGALATAYGISRATVIAGR